MKILIVDDSAMMRKILSRTVAQLGYEHLEANNGVEALNVLGESSRDVSLILLDWNMPEMDGYTLLQKVKEDERFKSIPVLMVTTEAERENVVKAIRAGAANYLTKPFSQEDLATKITESLGLGFA